MYKKEASGGKRRRANDEAGKEDLVCYGVAARRIYRLFASIASWSSRSGGCDWSWDGRAVAFELAVEQNRARTDGLEAN